MVQSWEAVCRERVVFARPWVISSCRSLVVYRMRHRRPRGDLMVVLLLGLLCLCLCFV